MCESELKLKENWKNSPHLLQNYGTYETSDGKPIMLQVGAVHNLLRRDCEHLIRQGVLEEEYT